MEHITAKRNRLMTVLLTILFATVLFCSALFAGFGYGATAESGNQRAAYKYTLADVSVTVGSGWIFTSNTPDTALYQMMSVTVTYTDNDGGDDLVRTLGISAGGTAATGESVSFTRNTSTRTVTAIVTPSGADFDPTPLSGVSAAYTLSSTSQVTVNGITAVFNNTSGYEVTTDTDLSDGNFIACIKAYEVYNDGSINNGGALSSISLNGDLFPSVLTAEILGGGTYSKAITVIDADDSRRTTSVLVTGIKFVAPDSITGITGTLQTQSARSARLNMNGLNVGMNFPSGIWIQVPVSALPSEYFTAKYTDANNKEVPSLGTSVKNIALTFTFPNVTPRTRNFNNITVSRISIHTPIFPNGLNATKSTLSWNEDGASVDITSWDFDGLYTDSGDAPAPELTVSPANAPEGADLSTFYTVTAGAEKQTVEFLKAGYLYHLYVTLPSGGDFMWGSPYNGTKSGDNMTMSFDVQVDKGTPTVTLGGIADVKYGTANSSGDITATVDGVEIGVDGGASKWTEISSTPAGTYQDDDDAWYYTLKYYTDASATNPVTNLRPDGKPKNVGTYYAVATTYENSGYKSVSSDALSFKIEQYEIDTAIADKTFARTDWTINDFLPSGNSLPYGESVFDVLDMQQGANTVTAATKFRHANNYTVKFTVKSTATNYKLKGNATVTFAIKTNEASTFDFAVSGWTYGTDGANPNIGSITRSNPYYPSNTGTLATDYTVKYYKYDDTKTNNKGAEVTIASASDFKTLEVGGYVVELTAKQNTADGDGNETAALTKGTAVDYTLPVVCKDFWVTATSILAPRLSAPWDLVAGNGGLVHTYNDSVNGQEYTFADWISNNTAADGSEIITVTITYVTPKTASPETVTGFANGKFSVNYAGVYTVTVTLNKNYSWQTTDGDNNAVWYPVDGDGNAVYIYSYYGYVAKQQLTVLTNGNITDGGKNEYDSTSQDKTITSWNKNALKITDVTVAGLDGVANHTPVSGGITLPDDSTPTDKRNIFGVTNAGKYTVKVDIADQDNYEWMGATTDAEKLRTLSLEYTLNRAPMKVTWSDGFADYNGTFDRADNTKYLRYEFDGGVTAQKIPEAKKNAYPSDNVNLDIDGYTLYNDDNGAFGSEITTVENVGHYRIVVSQISGTAAPNYYLPENDDTTYITNIATVFEIYAKTFIRPTLDGGDGVKIEDNDIEVVYTGDGYRISDFIRDFNINYKLDGKLRLDIKCGEDGTNNPLVKNVLWNADKTQILAYSITVTPADNYAWASDDEGDDPNETLTYTIKITQKTVQINWGTTEFTTTYGEVAEPTPTVGKAETGDVVNIDSLGYKKNNADVTDITSAGAGEYIVYAATLDNPNYVIDENKADWSIKFTVKKKALAKPTLNAGLFANATFGTPVTASLYSNTDSDKATWKNGTLFTAAVTAKLDKGWFDDKADIADDAAALVIDTSDTAKYSFDTATGVLTYYAAGLYTVTFTLTDSANYCWASDGKETAFTDTEAYSCAWGENKELTNKRMVIAAPALGNRRAMERDNPDQNKPLSDIFTGKLGSDENGVRYGVQYGVRDGDGFGAPQDEQPETKIGQYYVLLSATDKYNYTWTVEPDGEDNTFAKSSYITQIDGRVYKTEYTIGGGATVYLLYAITATQLDVELVVNNYIYGSNGFATGDIAITEAMRFVVDYTNENGENKVFDYQNHHTHEGEGYHLPEHKNPTYTFYKIIGKNTENPVRVLVDKNDLVEGLPWEAGDYEAEIVINFENPQEYQPWTDTRSFTVLKREIALEWIFGDDEENNTRLDGGKFTATYNGEEQKPTLRITNIPIKAFGDNPAVPQLTFAAQDIANKTAFVDAAEYTVDTVMFADTAAVNDNYKFGEYTLYFEITPMEVTLTAIKQNHTYGDELIFAASDCLTPETKNQFFEHDGLDLAFILMQVKDGDGAVLTDTLGVVYGGTYTLVPVFDMDNSSSENYKITVTTAAALTVQKRAITVTVTDNPTSVYSENIVDIDYTAALTSGGEGTAVVDTESDVFTIAARDSDGNVITNLSDASTYNIVLTISSLRGDNYDITFGTSKADEGKNTITHKGYTYEITKRLIKEKDDSIVANTLTYNGEQQKFLKDDFAVVIGNPEIAANAPVWSYSKDGGATWDTFTESPTVKDAGTYNYVIKVTAKNHDDLTTDITVTVGKAKLTVRFDLTIMFGEADPATVEYLGSTGYLFGLDNLRKQDKGWTVEGFVGDNNGEADRNLFYSAQGFYGLTGNAKYAVDGYDQNSLTAKYDINFIATEDGNATLTCGNYTFVGETGELKLKKPELTVEISDQWVTYNEQNATKIPLTAMGDRGYSALMPTSTYGGNYQVSEDLTEIFTVSTDAHKDKIATSTTGSIGDYVIRGTALLTDKYVVTFKGTYDETLTASDNGTCGKYTIKPAELTVDSVVVGYSAAYDEQWHSIFVNGVSVIKPDGTPTDGIVFATASDQTDVTVEYRVSPRKLAVLSKAEFEKLTLSDGVPKYRDVGMYYVYYSLSNDNYEIKLFEKIVEITIVDNELSVAFNFENNTVVLDVEGQTVKTAWTYGYKVDGGFDPDSDNANKVVEPTVKFKYTGNGNELGKVYFTLYYNDTSIWSNTVDADAANTVTDMFAELFALDGLNAGTYKLAIAMDDAKNYKGFTTIYIFNVAKRALTVKAAEPAEIEYGSEVPAFSDASVGLVANKAGGTADSIVDALGLAPVYDTAYNPGLIAGNAYRVFVRGKADGATDATSFTNYTVTYKDVYLTVVRRVITIYVADKENTYSLQDGETVQKLTFTVTDGSIYTAELVAGAPADGVYDNDNQKVLKLYTDAIVDNNTNNVIFDADGKVAGYPIYAVFKAGVDVNYEIRFDKCSNQEKTKTDAIGRDGSDNNAGSYKINKAIFDVDQKGVFHDDANGVRTGGTVYSGATNHYVATLKNDAETPIDFTYNKKGADGNYTPVENVVDVGEYQAVGSSTNTNYTSANLTINFEITQATLTLTAYATEVQYGTKLSGSIDADDAAGGAVATGRFKGFTYESKSGTLLADTLKAYLDAHTVGYKTTGYNANTSVGAECWIIPVCASDSNVIIAPVEASLTVKQRAVTVTMVGWDEDNVAKHNDKAWCYYLGTHDATQDALIASFNSNRSAYIYFADSKVVFGDSDDDCEALGISVSLPGNDYNADKHVYGYSARNNTNYVVTFDNTVAPEFCVKKAKLTLYAHPMQGEYAYTYGETIETLVDRDVYNVGVLTYSVGGMQNNEKFVNLLNDRNVLFTIVNAQGAAYEAWKSPVGKYTVSLMIKEGKNEYSPTAATFDNYEITSVVSASLNLKQRRIKAETANQTFGFDGTKYNGGVFGKKHNAVITFVDKDGNDANVNVEPYKSGFTLLYNTIDKQHGTYGTYQKKGEAPTVVGEYTVKVTLDANSNYVFENGTNNCTLDFNVTQLEIKEFDLKWDEVSFSTDGDDVPDTFTNFIENYVDDYFNVIRFVYTSTTGDGTQIEKGNESTLYTYYIKDQKMYIKVGHNIGTYTISFALKDSALQNLTLKSAIVGEATVSFAVSTTAVTITVEMADFTYGDQPSNPIVIINGGAADVGLTLTYALVTAEDAATLAADSEKYKGLENDTFTHGSYSSATNFNAGYYVLSATYQLNEIRARRYYVFHVDKRGIDAPATSVEDVTFNGSAQSVVIDYETAYMRPEFSGTGTMTAAGGIATFTATAVGPYSIRFILIDPANNVWKKDGVDGSFSDDSVGALTLTWNINKDESDNGAADPIVELPQIIDNITYGGAFNPDLVSVKNGYNGRVSLYIRNRTDDTAPAADPSATGWTPYNVGGRRIDANRYWLLVVVTDLTGRNYSPKATVGSFQIVPKTITASISGSMIYGTPLADTQFNNIEIAGLLVGDNATIGDYSYGLAEEYSKLNAGGSYDIILATDENDVVVGIDAGSNYIVKAERGSLTITKRAVTVTIESKSSDYSVTPVLTDVGYTVANLADGEDKSVLGIVFETDATAKSAAGGTYWITIKSYDGTNYEMTYQRMLYVINPLEIEVELVRQENITYGDANIKGATRGSITIANPAADKAFVNNDLQLVIRFTGGNGYDSFDVPTDAGTYTATLVGANSNYTLIGTPSIDFVIDRKTVDVTAFFIQSATYTGDEIAPRVDVRQQGSKPMYAPSVYAMTACTFVNAGTHNVTVSLTDPANYVWSSTSDVSVTLTFIINKANDEQTGKLVIAGWQYGCYDMAVNSPSATVKSGESIIYQYSVDGKTYTNVVPENGNAGKYYVRVTVAESQNYRAFIGEPVSFDIAKFVVTSPSLTVVTEGAGKNDVYTGDNLASGIVGFNPQLMQIAYGGNIQSLGDSVIVFARDAGTYTVSVSLFNAHNYRWSAGDDDNDGTITLTWTVARKKIAKPTHDDSTKIVNGSTIVYIPVGFDSSIMSIENNKSSYGGTFGATIKLKDTQNYEWETGDDMPFTIKWSIVGADTVFIAIITVLSVLAVGAAALVVVQFLLNKRRKRETASAMQAIEEANSPATEQAATDGQAKQPEAEQPASEPAPEQAQAENKAEQPEAEKSESEQPATEQPEAEKSESEQPAIEQPEAEQAADKKPAVKKSTAKKPAGAKSATKSSSTAKSTGKNSTAKSTGKTSTAKQGSKTKKPAQGNKGGAE